MAATWWVLGDASKTQFVGWSCGTIGDLYDAAVYRTEANATKKLESLDKFCPGEYVGFMPHQITVSL